MTARSLWDTCREFGGGAALDPPGSFRGWWTDFRIGPGGGYQSVFDTGETLGVDPPGIEFLFVLGLNAWEVNGRYYTTDSKTIKRWATLDDLRNYLTSLAAESRSDKLGEVEGARTDVLPPNPETLRHVGPRTVADDLGGEFGEGADSTRTAHRVAVWIDSHPADVPHYGHCVFGLTHDPATAAGWVGDLFARTAPLIRRVVRLAAVSEEHRADPRAAEQPPDDESYRAILDALGAEAALGPLTTYTAYRLAVTVTPNRSPLFAESWGEVALDPVTCPPFYYTGFTHDPATAEGWAQERSGKVDPQLRAILSVTVEPITYTAARPAPRSYPWGQVWTGPPTPPAPTT